MSYQKKVLPSAKKEFTAFCATYGSTFAAAARKWRDDIVNAAPTRSGEPLTEISVEELLERMLDTDENNDPIQLRPSVWQHSRRRFREASWRERARAALVFFRSLSPPWEQRVSRRTFPALGVSDLLEMFAYYEVNHADRSVVFTKFEVWTAR